MRVLLIDALNIIRRIYEAIPDKDTEAGLAQVVESSVRAMLRYIKDTEATHALCVFEGAGPTWRHQKHPAYKSKRKPTPDGVKQACSQIRNEFDSLGIAHVSSPGIEADDVIATVASELSKRDKQSIILSSDHDFCQLVCPNIWIYHPVNRAYLDGDWVTEKYQVAAARLPELLALAGNSADSIPGAPGVGPKKAADLLNRFGSLDELISSHQMIGGKIGEQIGLSANEIRLSLELVSLRQDLSLGINLRDLRLADPTGIGV